MVWFLLNIDLVGSHISDLSHHGIRNAALHPYPLPIWASRRDEMLVAQYAVFLLASCRDATNTPATCMHGFSIIRLLGCAPTGRWRYPPNKCYRYVAPLGQGESLFHLNQKKRSQTYGAAECSEWIGMIAKSLFFYQASPPGFGMQTMPRHQSVGNMTIIRLL
jgi:hypothetical protein